MIPIARVCAEIPGLTEADVRSWLALDLVQPPLHAGEPAFRDIDVARIRLIYELHAELEVETPTVPVVLSLLDQLYAARRQLRLAIGMLNAEAQQDLADALTRHFEAGGAA